MIEIREPAPAVLPIPVNPIMYAALRAIYAAGSRYSWKTDSFGRPHFSYKSRDGHINLFCELPANNYLPWQVPAKGLPVFHRHFLGPRWGFIHAGRVREAVADVSVETADVFLILMAKIAKLANPADIARIRLDEIAEQRGVKIRHGSSLNLYNDFKKDIVRLADLRLTIKWRDYKNNGTLSYGTERPDRLLDIVDLKYQKKKTLPVYEFRCGQAMTRFLNPQGLRWIGYYSKSLLQLSPYHESSPRSWEHSGPCSE